MGIPYRRNRSAANESATATTTVTVRKKTYRPDDSPAADRCDCDRCIAWLHARWNCSRPCVDRRKYLGKLRFLELPCRRVRGRYLLGC